MRADSSRWCSVAPSQPPALAQAELASAGGWDGATLHHRLESARIEEARLGVWRLGGGPELAVRRDELSIGAHCWEQESTQLCVAALGWTPARAHLEADLRDFDLQRLGAWLEIQDIALAGRLQASVAGAMTDGTLTGSAAARLEDATLYYAGGDEPLETHFETARLDAQFTPDGATATLDLASSSGPRLAASARMEGPAGLDAPFYGEMIGRLPDISPLMPVLGGYVDVAEVAGEIDIDASVGGTLRTPQLTGFTRLSGGTVVLTDLGVRLDDITVALLGDGSETLRLRGSARAGGPLTLTGEVMPLAPGGVRGWVRVRGNRVDAVRLPDRYVQVTPDVTLRYEAGALAAEGRVEIPQADIVIRELPANAVAPSQDAVVVDRPDAEVRGDGAPIGGEIDVVFGRNVRLRAFGLDTRIEGTLSLAQGPGREPAGYGVVRLREGKFGAYGKELEIERGSLGFSGPLDDPAVDLRAGRRVEWEGRTVTAGIIVSGTASRPQSRVFSEPAMSQADALSYLISGRPMQSANPDERSSIASAALALGVRQQASPLTQRLGTALTLDELGMQGGPLGETELVAGKQLGQDLYVRFAYGLFNQIGTVLARYRINRNLSIEASSGESQALDLVWSVETD
jgi:translocation and assembly module TamB